MLPSSHRPMPVSGFFDRATRRGAPGFSVPWAMLAPHDEQAKKNHCGQNLQRLYERHGMSADEVLAVLDDRPWYAMDPVTAHAELIRRVAKFESERRY